MKTTLLFSLLLFVALTVSGQNSSDNNERQLPDSLETSTKICITVGVLQGGGSLLGADFEIKIKGGIALQVGAGFTGFGTGINYHYNPGMKNSFLSLSYWHQGIGATYTQSVFGPTFVYRHRRGFTAQIGIGRVLDVSPLGRRTYEKLKINQPTVMFLYSIGWYFPDK